MFGATEKNVDAVLCSKKTDLTLGVTAYQGHDNDFRFFSLEVIDRRKSDCLQQLLLLDGLLGARVVYKFFVGELLAITITKAYFEVTAKSSSELLELARVRCQKRDVFGSVLTLSDQVTYKSSCHVGLPPVAVRFDPGAVTSNILRVAMVQPEHIVKHTDNIWRIQHTFMIDQVRVDSTNQLGNLGPHSSLDVELRER